MKHKITPEQCVQALKEHGTKQAASEALGIPTTTFRNYLKMADGTVEKDSDNAPMFERLATILYKDKKDPDQMTLHEVMNGFSEAQGFRAKFDIKQLEASCEIPTKKPIALVHISDVHIGSPHTDYQAILEDAELIKKNKNLYVMLGGDISDKMGTFRDAGTATGQLHPTTIQIATQEKYIEYLGDSIVAKIGGNHDTMDSRRSGVDSEYFINKGKKYPFLPYGGLIRLRVGKVDYKILWKHTYRFKSSLNQFNSHHRMLEMLEPTADIAVLEHEHNPGIESVEKGEFDSRRTVVSIRTGAYKISDSFSMNYYKSGRTAPQTVVLFPDERKILAMHGRDAIKDAITYLKGYDGKKAKN